MEIKHYTKRPVDVEAIEVKLEDLPNIASLVNGEIVESFDQVGNPVKTIQYRTIQGWNYAKAGDYIIHEANVYYTITDESFKYMFEPK